VVFKISFKLLAAAFLVIVGLGGMAWLAQAGSGQYPTRPGEETAVLSSGCFWGLQERLRDLPGVIKTRVGYTGGQVPAPTFEMVASGKTGHVEAVEVLFDPSKLTYAELLRAFLTPRKTPGQTLPAAIRSRCIIFYDSARQENVARQAVQQIKLAAGSVPYPVVDITPARTFYLAEDYHQDYYRKNLPAGGCSLF
jgi:methionine-S-sulfoxide reductase